MIRFMLNSIIVVLFVTVALPVLFMFGAGAVLSILYLLGV